MSRARTPITLAALLAVVALAGCGAETSAKGLVARPTPTLTPTPAVSPTPIAYPQTWQPAADLPTAVGGFAFAQSAPQIGYACALAPGSGHGAALWSTQDGGTSWSQVSASNLTLSPTECHVSIDPADPQDIFAWDSAIMNRSQDGGLHWKQLAGLVGQTGPSMWRNATAIGSRLLAVGVAVGPGAGAGNQSDLWASDDSGQTWKSIGQSILAQQLNVGNFATLGQTLYVSGYPLCAGGLPIDGCNGDAQARISGGFAATARAVGSVALTQPFSGDKPVAYRYFASTDGGTTFTELSVPGAASLSELSFTPKVGGGYYGVVLSTANDLTTTVFWSANGGRTWQSMPPLDASTPGKPDPRTLGILGRLIVAPNGTIIAGVWQTRDPADGGGDLGLYQLPGGIVFAHWQPLAPPGYWMPRAIPQGANALLWSLRYTGSLWQGSAQSTGTLAYVSVQTNG